jgi:hypothetical protein
MGYQLGIVQWFALGVFMKNQILDVHMMKSLPSGVASAVGFSCSSGCLMHAAKSFRSSGVPLKRRG